MSKIVSLFESKFYLRLLLVFAAGIIMAAFVMLTGGIPGASCIIEIAVIGGLMCACFVLPIITQKGLPLAYMIVAIFVTAALVYLRLCMFGYESGDYLNFLSKWLEQIRGMTPIEAMRADIGDYNMPYLYILIIISCAKLNDLFIIKLVSCLFDALAAMFVMKIVTHFRGNGIAGIISYLLTLALPTVWLNGAMWGQCDVMFTAFCLGMMWAILKGKSNLATILWALAFALKLQAIFVLPVLIVALLTKRIKATGLIWIVPVFFATLLPAMLCGRGFIDCVKIYFEQAGQYPYMHLNIPSIWVLVGHVDFNSFNSAAIFLAGGATLTFLFLCYHWRKGIDDKNLITILFIGALLMPFLLPRMHDRYYFVADIAALALFLIDFKKWYVPLVTVLSSYMCYYQYLMGGQYLIDLKYAAVAILVVLTLMLKDLFCQISAQHNQKINPVVQIMKN